MTSEEIRLRSLHLYLACSYAAVKFRDSVLDELREAGYEVNQEAADIVLKEVGILFRFWTTRQIWERLVENEGDAKSLNFSLIHLFNRGFKLPRDEIGERYAQISGTVEEVKEFGYRICNALGTKEFILALKLNASCPAWLKAVLQYTQNAIEWPIPRVKEIVEELSGLDKEQRGRKREA